MTENEIAFRAALQMYDEQKDAIEFLKTIVALSTRDNEYAQAYLSWLTKAFFELKHEQGSGSVPMIVDLQHEHTVL